MTLSAKIYMGCSTHITLSLLKFLVLYAIPKDYTKTEMEFSFAFIHIIINYVLKHQWLFVVKGGLFSTINAYLQALKNSSILKQPYIAQKTAILFYASTIY